MKLKIDHTKYACYAANGMLSILGTLPPLLYVIFKKDFGLSLDQISVFIILTFGLQMVFSCLSAQSVRFMGYRISAMASLFMIGAGILAIGILPFIMPPFWGIALATTISGTASGIIGVLINPITDWLPEKTKRGAMGMLHSFYCWGCAAVTLITALFLQFSGEQNWRYLPFIWSVPVFLCALYFGRVQLPEKEVTKEKGDGSYIKSRLFIIFMLMLLCAGAVEKSMGQWTSLFAQLGLKVSQFIGNILGPFTFALLMGASRALFSKIPDAKLFGSQLTFSILTFLGYMTAVFSPEPLIALIGCGLTGFFLGPLWPGMYRLCGSCFPTGGAPMFAAVSVAGFIGCTLGPSITGFVSDSVIKSLEANPYSSANATAVGLSAGLFAASLFCAAFALLAFIAIRTHKSKKI